MVKLYIGQMWWINSQNGYNYLFNADFENGNFDGFQAYQFSPAGGDSVRQSGLMVQSPGATYDLTQLRYGKSY